MLLSDYQPASSCLPSLISPEFLIETCIRTTRYLKPLPLWMTLSLQLLAGEVEVQSSSNSSVATMGRVRRINPTRQCADRLYCLAPRSRMGYFMNRPNWSFNPEAPSPSSGDSLVDLLRLQVVMRPVGDTMRIARHFSTAIA